MAVIEYDEYKQKLLALEPTLGELEKALGIPKAREELAALIYRSKKEIEGQVRIVSIPGADVCACCGKPAKHMIYWGVAY